MKKTSSGPSKLQQRKSLELDWYALWPKALESWSSYTQLRDPVFLKSPSEAKQWNMKEQIAAIRLSDQQIMINLCQIETKKLEKHAIAILAHEIGHHVYVPGNRSDHARMLAIAGSALYELPEYTLHMVSNLYSDLLINERLQRVSGLAMDAVYHQLAQDISAKECSQVWKVYTRIYEYLWHLPAGTLAPVDLSDSLNADAALLARIIRHYASKWLYGVKRFCHILYPYLLEDQKQKCGQTFIKTGLSDTKDASLPGENSRQSDMIPDGLASFDPAELDDDDFDEILAGSGLDSPIDEPQNTEPTQEADQEKKGQFREPFSYGQILKSLGLNLKKHEITTRYYRERALPHLIPFPSRQSFHAKEPLFEGYETWEPTDTFESLDIMASLSRSPVLFPGVTTVQRVYGEVSGTDPGKTPLDLDIYVDCSGSMPNPAQRISYLALAGTILALSALRMGARVQATLWSGPGRFDTTGGFLQDEACILGVITGYLSGSTAFPIHILRETYQNRKPNDRKVHIVVISDDGVTTIMNKDEKRNSGSKISKMALEKAGGGGTLVLNLYRTPWKPQEKLEALGFEVYPVSNWEQLISFARNFVRKNYE